MSNPIQLGGNHNGDSKTFVSTPPPGENPITLGPDTDQTSMSMEEGRPEIPGENPIVLGSATNVTTKVSL